jgi:CubicO group peptidase (beta-lactamase class C family)
MSTAIEGQVEAGFEPVADSFIANFEELGELGAAFAAYVEGRPVVDIWGGIAHPGERRPWQRDTLQLVFSGTKGLTATCMLMVADRGLLDLEGPVADVWPEFAAHGKAEISVADVMTHQAGLAAITTDLQMKDLLEPMVLSDLLGDQAPHWEEGQRFAYHALTFGWLCDAILRRVAGVGVGRFFAAEVAEPLGLEAWIGLPGELEERISEISTRNFELDPPASDYGRRVYFNPPVFAEPLRWNAAEFHAAENASLGGIATARSLARLYSCLAQGGSLDGVRLCSPEAVARATALRVRGKDPYTDEAAAFGLGFQLQTEMLAYGPPLDGFGHTGAGGSVHGAWPRHRVGFSYCMNEMRSAPGDARARRILTALFECI